MNHFIVSSILTCISSFLATIYFIMRKKTTARLFGLYWLSIAFWSFTVGFQFHLLKVFPDFIWGWFLHLGCIYIPVLFFHFALCYSGHIRHKVTAVKICYAIATLFVVLNTVSPYFTHQVVYRHYYAYPKPALVYPLYFVFFVTLISWGTILLLRPERKFTIVSRKRLLLFVILNILAYLGGFDNFLIMADIRIFPLYPFGLYLVVPYAIIGAYVISKSLTRFERAMR